MKSLWTGVGIWCEFMHMARCGRSMALIRCRQCLRSRAVPGSRA